MWCFLLAVTDGPSSKWTTVERATGVDEWVNGWRTSRCAEDQILELPKFGDLDVVLGYNTLGYQMPSGPARFEFSFVQMPSHSRGVPRKEWATKVHVNVNGEIRDWTFDDTQDLLILLEKYGFCHSYVFSADPVLVRAMRTACGCTSCQCRLENNIQWRPTLLS